VTDRPRQTRRQPHAVDPQETAPAASQRANQRRFDFDAANVAQRAIDDNAILISLLISPFGSSQPG
jgi:hypothetical protein